MKAVILGSSCMFPTKERSQPAVLLINNGDYLLFDAGEGVQRQLRIKKVSPMKINDIFLTHWHGDHSLGIPGLIQSMSGNKRIKELRIHGPEGTKERLDHLLKSFDFMLTFPIKINEIRVSTKPKRVARINDLTVNAIKVKHKTACIAFNVVQDSKRKINLKFTKKYGLTKHPLLGKLQKGRDITYNDKLIKAEDATIIVKGKKFSYVTDTGLFDKLISFVKDSDLLICEATYASDMKNKAKEHSHLTSVETAMLAKKAGVKKLVITHFSQRYKSVKPILDEAKKVFKDTIAAKDFMEIKV